MPLHYPVEFRLDACRRMLAGECVASLAEELGVHSRTLYKWRTQALIDEGRRSLSNKLVDE